MGPSKPGSLVFRRLLHTAKVGSHGEAHGQSSNEANYALHVSLFFFYLHGFGDRYDCAARSAQKQPSSCWLCFSSFRRRQPPPPAVPALSRRPWAGKDGREGESDMKSWARRRRRRLQRTDLDSDSFETGPPATDSRRARMPTPLAAAAAAAIIMAFAAAMSPARRLHDVVRQPPPILSGPERRDWLAARRSGSEDDAAAETARRALAHGSFGPSLTSGRGRAAAQREDTVEGTRMTRISRGRWTGQAGSNASNKHVWHQQTRPACCCCSASLVLLSEGPSESESCERIPTRRQDGQLGPSRKGGA